jgi:hypothetical protein
MERTVPHPVYLTENELILVLRSLLLAEATHLQEAQKELQVDALDKFFRHLEASESCHELAERISGMKDFRALHRAATCRC